MAVPSSIKIQKFLVLLFPSQWNSVGRQMETEMFSCVQKEILHIFKVIQTIRSVVLLEVWDEIEFKLGVFS